ncbi:putative triacylglycerol lipase [Lupinus albus]|uniref:Putative triacylglycerol lipase n=1 Tax=Lupinus albus TaxID=3870 RepID=A0A6A4P125_LUPAL|nr:putative triacylglycerol lipase [Lupinus albus]
MAGLNIFWVVFLMIQQTFFSKANSTESLVATLYVFGDSSVDAGNNNNINKFAKANRYPYGIDFNNKSTGRFTNGKTFADIIAINLGLPLPPPYLGVSESERYKVATGFNYASRACGIVNDTRNGDCLSLDKQVKYFNSTVTNDLQKHFQSKEEVPHHLSESLYLLSIGSCDYALNYFRRTTYKDKTPIEFVDYLLENLVSKLKELYNMGARKFVVAVAG